MKNTIELLEAIGSNASLRHFSGEDLARTLEGMHATDGLRQAAELGDSSPLRAELGPRTMEVNHTPNQSPAPCDEEGDADELPGAEEEER